MAKSKTIREAIHGDVELEALEIEVINTRVFQRLHGIKQLGMAYVVYPTATHTRFEHVIGCVHVAQRIINQINKVQPGSVDDDLRRGIRMSTLLHDIAHVPYGHTLEDELSVLTETHDSTDVRVPRFLNRLEGEVRERNSKVADQLRPLLDFALSAIATIHFIEEHLHEPAADVPVPAGILPRDRWFVADIVGNTICADLLDYARRDMRSAGLNQDYDDRIYSYFELAKDQTGNQRLALRVARQQGLRLDAVSEILNVLRIRYTLSERILFHHAKNIASAMLGEAISRVSFGPVAFDDMRDEEVLPWLHGQAETSGFEPEEKRRLINLVERLQARHLHKMIYRVGLAQQASYQVQHSRHLGDDFSSAERRRAFQAEICANIPQLEEGDVIIYCPAPKMRMKEVWANVLTRKDDNVCRPLRLEQPPYLPDVVVREINELEEKYRALWSWNVFLVPEKLPYAFAVQTFIRERLQVTNDPFLQASLEAQDELKVAVELKRRADGPFALQAKAVELYNAEPAAFESAAAEGPETTSGYYDDLLRRAREELYRSSTPLT